MNSEAPLGTALLDIKFFHSYLTYNARIDATFSGDFNLKLNYTHHSQYLNNITLTGSLDSNIVVNQLNNIIGNSDQNKVKFTGNSSQYSIEKQDNGATIITDTVSSGGGVSILSRIESAVSSGSNITL